MRGTILTSSVICHPLELQRGEGSLATAVVAAATEVLVVEEGEGEPAVVSRGARGH